MKWTPDLLKQHYDEKLADLSHRLDGFPQEFQTRVDGEQLEKIITEIRADHVQRREIEEVKKAVSDATENVRRRLDEGTGRRAAGTIAVSVVATMLVVMLGWVVENGLTSADVSTQIQREAPWNRDRPDVLRRVAVVEASNERLQDRVAELESQNRFFCRTRTQAGLPGC